MGQKLYLECYSGISGDMTVGALLDLGANEEVLRKALTGLPVPGFQVEISRVKKSGIDACDFNVVLDANHDNHDHDMDYLYGHEQTAKKYIPDHAHHPEEDHDHDHTHHSEEDHEHDHAHYSEEDHDPDHTHHPEEDHEHDHAHHPEEDHDHDHTHHPEEDRDHDHAHHSEEHHHHEHRGMPEIRSIIMAANMTDRAKELALHIFTILAEAESVAHNVPVDQVHFHEVGAVDSIVDIISVAVCLDDLNITDVVVTELREGTGTVRCQHGILPVPVPAVLNIVKAHDIPLQITEWKGEFVTPTGAAIVAAIRTSDKLPERFRVKRVGIGAGKRVYDGPGMLRAMLIEE